MRGAVEETKELDVLDFSDCGGSKRFFEALQTKHGDIRFRKITEIDWINTKDLTKPGLLICLNTSRIDADIQPLRALPKRSDVLLIFVYCTPFHHSPATSNMEYLRNNFPDYEIVEMDFNVNGGQNGILVSDRNEIAYRHLREFAAAYITEIKSRFIQPKHIALILIFLVGYKVWPRPQPRQFAIVDINPIDIKPESKGISSNLVLWLLNALSRLSRWFPNRDLQGNELLYVWSVSMPW